MDKTTRCRILHKHVEFSDGTEKVTKYNCRNDQSPLKQGDIIPVLTIQSLKFARLGHALDTWREKMMTG